MKRICNYIDFHIFSFADEVVSHDITEQVMR